MINSPLLKERRKNQNFTPFVLSEPIECFVNPWLSHMEKRFLSLLLNMCQSEEGCTISNEFFATYFDCSESTITNCVSYLQRYGYIEVKIVKTGPEIFNIERRIHKNLSYPTTYQKAVQFFYSHFQTLPSKILWEYIKEIIPPIDKKQSSEEDPSLKKLRAQEPNVPSLKKLRGNNIYNNTNSILKPNNVLNNNTLNSDSKNRISKPGESQADIQLSFDPSLMDCDKPTIVKKLNRRSETDLPLPTSCHLGITDLFKKRELKEKEKRKVIPFQNIPTPIQEIIDHWKNLGFNFPNPETAAKGFNDAIRSLKAVQVGKLIPRETRKFSPEQIKDTITRFSMLAFDDYGFYTPEMRKKFATKSLKDFLYTLEYNNGSPKPYTITPSWFIKCFDMEPPEKVEPVKLESVENKHPETTNRLVSFYYKYAFAGLKKKLTVPEENKFREAANAVCDLHDKLKSRNMRVHLNGYGEIADILCRTIKDYYGEKVTKVFPGSFSTPFIRSRMLAFMNEKGYFPDSDFEIKW
jgi:hypothetical protein